MQELNSLIMRQLHVRSLHQNLVETINELHDERLLTTDDTFWMTIHLNEVARACVDRGLRRCRCRCRYQWHCRCPCRCRGFADLPLLLPPY